MQTTAKQPLVSVIIPCYNQGKFLRDALESVTQQTYQDLEIIVVNDGSHDDTAEVAKSFGERVSYVYQENAGQGAARNTGASRAKGDLLQFLDSDDLLAPDHIELHVQAFLTHPEVSVFYGSWKSMRFDGTVENRLRSQTLPDDQYHRLLVQNVAPPCCMTLKREAFELAGGFEPNRDFRGSEDWELWLRMSLAGEKFAFVPGSLSFYRQHGGATTSSYDRMWESGKLVLLRYAKSHGDNCLLCKVSLNRGYRLLRAYCCLRATMPSVIQHVNQGNNRKAVDIIRERLNTDPATAPTLARGLVSAMVKGQLRRTG